MITFYDSFKSIYRLSGSIDKGLTGEEREEGDENCRDRSRTPVFNDRSNSFHYRTSLRPSNSFEIDAPNYFEAVEWKKGKKEKKGEKERNEKKKENVGAAKGKRRESIKSWSGPYENFLGYRKNSTDPMTFLHRKCQRLNRFETVDFASRRVQKSPRTLPFSLPLLPSPPFFSHPHLFPLVLSPFFALEKKFFFPRPPKNQAKNGPALIRFPRTLLEKWWNVSYEILIPNPPPTLLCNLIPDPRHSYITLERVQFYA